MNYKISKYQLSKIFYLARQKYLEDSQTKYGLDNQEFVAFCYLYASQQILGVDITIDISSLKESIEDIT